MAIINQSTLKSRPAPLQSKLPLVGTTIFTTMSQLANEQQAINLSQGFPDFDVPVKLAEMLSHYVHTGHNQYPPMMGLAYLRQQIAAKTQSLAAAAVDPET